MDVDVKTLLLLGAGMLVLALVAFCSVQSRAAGLGVRDLALTSAAGSVTVIALQTGASRLLMKGKIPAAPVGAKPVGRLRPFERGS
jgi:hypothetical protein